MEILRPPPKTPPHKVHPGRPWKGSDFWWHAIAPLGPRWVTIINSEVRGEPEVVSQMVSPSMAAAKPVKKRRIARRRSGRSLNIAIVRGLVILVCWPIVFIYSLVGGVYFTGKRENK